MFVGNIPDSGGKRAIIRDDGAQPNWLGIFIVLPLPPHLESYVPSPVMISPAVTNFFIRRAALRKGQSGREVYP